MSSGVQSKVTSESCRSSKLWMTFQETLQKHNFDVQ
jgi:hypothetical protein